MVVAVAASRLIEASCFARPIPNRQRCSMPTSLKTLSSAVRFRASIDGRVLFRRVPVRNISPIRRTDRL